MENIPKTLIIVPAYNEAESISDTLQNLMELKKNVVNIDVCVINDGSRDATADIVRRFPVHLISLPFNLGIGSAMQTGYKYALKHNYDIAVQFDADGQHAKEDLLKIIQPVADGESDMVVGSRFLEKTDYKGSAARRVGIGYFTFLLKLLTRHNFTDPTSGYRAKNRAVIQLFSEYYPKDYPEPEVLVHLLKKRMRVQEVSVQMNQRQGGNSSINSLKAVYYMLKVSLSVCMQRLKSEVEL